MTKAEKIMEKIAAWNPSAKYKPTVIDPGVDMTTKAYKKGKVTKETDKQVDYQIPKSNIPLTNLSYGIEQKDWKLDQYLKKGRDGAKDTLFHTANPLKHLLTKDKRKK